MVGTVLEMAGLRSDGPGWDSIPAGEVAACGGFPFRLVYLVQPPELVVVAVAHGRRLPGYWRERLSE